MKRKRLYAALAGVVLVTVLALVLVFGVFGGQPGATTGEEAALASADGGSEGIQVHGHWTIEVREADGALVSRQEFDNALVGNHILVRSLIGDWTVGPWRVMLSNTMEMERPFLTNGNRCAGHLLESRDPLSGPCYFPTLTVSSITTPYYAMVLSGTATAAVDGSINVVQTQVSVCPNDLAPTECVSGDTYCFTSAVQPEISETQVLEGQQILVEVVISFSGP